MDSPRIDTSVFGALIALAVIGLFTLSCAVAWVFWWMHHHVSCTLV